MVSRAPGREPATRSSLLVLAALALPCAGWSQAEPEVSRPASDALPTVVATIEDEQAEGGVRSEELVDPLAALGLLYEESGDHALAVSAIERARHLVRVNYGLHSLKEADLIRHLIRSEKARGNREAVAALQQNLLDLARRHRDDLRSASIFRELGDRRLADMRRFRDRKLPDDAFFECFFGSSQQPFAICDSGSRSAFIGRVLGEAWGYYEEAIGVLLHHELYASDELLALERDLLRSRYLHMDPRSSAKVRVKIKEQLQRLVAYAAARHPSSPVAQVTALVQLADWDLLYSNNAKAVEAYEGAYAYLRKEGVAEASIEQIFSPDVPVVLPALLPNPLESAETERTAGHIDVAFDITKYGVSRRIEVLETTTNAGDPEKRRLVNLIAGSRFRPTSADGDFGETSRHVLRYHLDDQAAPPKARRP